MNADHMKLSNPIVLEKLTLEDLNEMPVMRNDTLRIDHTNIMKSIEKIIQKSKAPHTKTEAGTPLILGYSKVPPLKSCSQIVHLLYPMQNMLRLLSHRRKC
uniref:Uncharacterized protein n=1 Tax=Cacopsylla melanoneura TaxID=428564 RepID=A0A8D9AM28_9HEMI